jgi:VanZ family protein
MNMQAEHRRLLHQAAFWCCLASVSFLALTSRDMRVTTGWDKSNHLLAFSVLGVLGILAWRHRLREVLGGLLAYGCLIEVAQSFVPNRSASWEDVVADSLGLLIGWLAASVVPRCGRSHEGSQ